MLLDQIIKLGMASLKKLLTTAHAAPATFGDQEGHWEASWQQQHHEVPSPLASHLWSPLPPGVQHPFPHGGIHGEEDDGGRGRWAVGIPRTTQISHGMTTPSQPFLFTETRLGSPHKMPVTPAFGPNGLWKEQYTQVHIGINVGNVSNRDSNLRKSAIC